MTVPVPVTPRPAAAVVLAREEADHGLVVFMVRRHVGNDFMPDVFVFPGGSVIEADRQLERVPGLCGPVGAAAPILGTGFHVAALRECFEEAGVLLARRDGMALPTDAATATRFASYRTALHAGVLTLAEIVDQERLTLATDDLLHWAHWITPEVWPKRFDVHFFLGPMPVAQQAAHDQLETTDGIWISPAEAVARGEAQDLPIADVTLRQLQQLSGLRSLAEAHDRFAGKPVPTILPVMIRQDEEWVTIFPDHS